MHLKSRDFSDDIIFFNDRLKMKVSFMKLFSLKV